MRGSTAFSCLIVTMGTLVACAHSSESRQQSTTNADATARSDAARPLIFAGRCVPNVLRLPVRADIEPGRTPNIDQVLFLRPLCIADQAETLCHVRPNVIVDQGGRAFHGDGVAVVSVINPDPRHLTVSVDRFDETIVLADGLALTEASSVIEDGCVKIAWTSEGLGKLDGVRGDFTRVDLNGPWMFRPVPRLCAAAHVPGDDQVLDAAFPVTGKGTTAIPEAGLHGAHVIGTLRGPAVGSTPYSAVVDQVIRMEWRVGDGP